VLAAISASRGGVLRWVRRTFLSLSDTSSVVYNVFMQAL
jgi:hypothetical protein